MSKETESKENNESASKGNEAVLKDAAKEVEEKQEKKEVKVASPFVTEQDTFDVTVRFYRVDQEVVVEGINDEFDPKHDDITDFRCTFKYVSQGDSELVLGLARSSGETLLTQLSMYELARLEFARLATLLRGWSLDEEWTNDNLMRLHPRIVKSLCNSIREKIGFDGII